jgi:hypothetical protein
MDGVLVLALAAVIVICADELRFCEVEPAVDADGPAEAGSI